MLRILRFVIIYILVVVRLALVLLPIFTLLYAVLYALKVDLIIILPYLYNICLLIVLLFSMYSAFYLVADMVFGISVSKVDTINCIEYDKWPRMHWLGPILNDAKAVFQFKNIRLYLDRSEAINAYSVGSFKGQKIVLSFGLIEHITQRSKDLGQQYMSIAAIIGHEMSHLVNRDFLPGMLMMISQRNIDYIVHICDILINGIKSIIGLIPFIGSIVNHIISAYYTIIRWFSNVTYSMLMMVNQLLCIAISRYVEYRSDYDAASAFGADSIISALEMLDIYAYNSIFSTHPKTIDRINAIKELERGVIRDYVSPSIITSMANYVAVILIFACLIYASIVLKIWLLPEYLSYISDAIMQRLSSISTVFSMFKAEMDKIREMIAGLGGNGQ